MMTMINDDDDDEYDDDEEKSGGKWGVLKHDNVQTGPDSASSVVGNSQIQSTKYKYKMHTECMNVYYKHRYCSDRTYLTQVS